MWFLFCRPVQSEFDINFTSYGIAFLSMAGIYLTISCLLHRWLDLNSFHTQTKMQSKNYNGYRSGTWARTSVLETIREALGRWTQNCIINCRRPRLQHALLTLIRTLVITKLDQCNSVLVGTSVYLQAAGPTAVRAECRRSACLLAPDVRIHNPTATGASLVGSEFTSGCVFWRTIVCMAQHRRTCLTACSAADIRDRRSSLSSLCWQLTPWHYRCRRLVGLPLATDLSGGCSADMGQSVTWDSGLLLTFDIPKGDQVSFFRQSYGWFNSAVYSDRQQSMRWAVQQF